jgi:hypothetical protein
LLLTKTGRVKLVFFLLLPLYVQLQTMSFPAIVSECCTVCEALALRADIIKYWDIIEWLSCQQWSGEQE